MAPGDLVAALALDQHGTGTDPGLDPSLGGGDAGAGVAVATAAATAAAVASGETHCHGVGAEGTEGMVPAAALLPSGGFLLRAGAGPRGAAVHLATPPPPQQQQHAQRTECVVLGARAAQDGDVDERERSEHERQRQGHRHEQQQHQLQPQQQQHGSAAAPAASSRTGVAGTSSTLAKFRRSVELIKAAMAFRCEGASEGGSI